MQTVYRVMNLAAAQDGDDEMVMVSLKTLDGKNSIGQLMSPEESRGFPLWSRWQVDYVPYLDGSEGRGSLRAEPPQEGDT